jgi:hypothetical protein
MWVLHPKCAEGMNAQNMMEERVAECALNGLKEEVRIVLQMRGICPECIKGGKVESVFLLCELVV